MYSSYEERKTKVFEIEEDIFKAYGTIAEKHIVTEGSQGEELQCMAAALVVSSGRVIGRILSLACPQKRSKLERQRLIALFIASLDDGIDEAKIEDDNGKHANNNGNT